MCRILDEELNISYVGSLASYQKIELRGSQAMTLGDFGKQLIKEHQSGQHRFFKTTLHYKGNSETHYSYCGTHRTRGFFKRQRLVVSFNTENLSDLALFQKFTFESCQIKWRFAFKLQARLFG
jgi:hypothetical protein